MDLFKDLFIFEMANNHQGSLEHGLRIIQAMADIKNQAWDPCSRQAAVSRS